MPLESSDSSDSQIIVAEPITSSPNSQNNGQQVTAQVAVVQAQGSPNGQQFITFSGKICEYLVIKIDLTNILALSLMLTNKINKLKRNKFRNFNMLLLQLLVSS